MGRLGKFIKRKLQQFILFLVEDYKKEVEENSKIIIEDLNSKIDYLNDELCKSNTYLFNYIENTENKINEKMHGKLYELQQELIKREEYLSDTISLLIDKVADNDDKSNELINNIKVDIIDIVNDICKVNDDIFKVNETVSNNKQEIEESLSNNVNEVRNKLDYNVDVMNGKIDIVESELTNDLISTRESISILEIKVKEEVENINSDVNIINSKIDTINNNITDINIDIDDIDLQLELMQERYLPTYDVNNNVLNLSAKEYSKTYDLENGYIKERIYVNGTWTEVSSKTKELQKIENKIDLGNLENEIDVDLKFKQGNSIVITDELNEDRKYRIKVENNYVHAEEIFE